MDDGTHQQHPGRELYERDAVRTLGSDDAWMSEEQSVKALKSRFEQSHLPSRPPVAPKPANGTTTSATSRPPLKAKPSLPISLLSQSERTLRLNRQETDDSLLSDPFGSPLNSPVIEQSESKPPLPGNRPRSTPEQNLIDVKSLEASEESLLSPRHGLLTVPVPRVARALDVPRSSSTKPAPPPPSPRLKSPRPMQRTSVDLLRPAPIMARNIFGDSTEQSCSSPENTFEATETDRYRESSTSSRSNVHSESRPAPVARAETTENRHPVQSIGRKTRMAPPSSRPTSPEKATDANSMSGGIQRGLSPSPHSRSAVASQQKPSLPSRPVATHAPYRTASRTAEASDNNHTNATPRLPKRLDLSVPSPVEQSQHTTAEVPPLPSRFAVNHTSREARPSRQSLQDDRRSIQIPVVSRQSLDGFKSDGNSVKTPLTVPNDDSDGDGDSSTLLDNARALDQPDASTANRKAPRFRGTHWDLLTGKEIRRTALSGDLLMIAHNDKLKLHNILTGEVIWQLPVVDTRVTAMEFRTVNTENLEQAGQFLWVAFKDGSIHELDLRNRVIVERYFHAHSGSIIAILRDGQAMWTMDEGGNLQVWSNKTTSTLKGKPSFVSMRTVLGVSVALVIEGRLWLGAGRAVHIFDPSRKKDSRLTPDRGLEPGKITGLITSAVHLPHTPDLVYFGHDDGKISIYSRSEHRCVEVLSISHYNLSGLLGVGDYLWASFKTGKIFVYDVHSRPWRVMKEWHAHKSPILELAIDRHGLWKEKRLQVSSMAGDGALKVWDGLLMEDWLDAEMQRRVKEFSTFEPVSTLVCTWNAGASLPHRLSRDYEDAQFIERMIRQADGPDIIVFGFQELVDLDDKGKAGKSVAKGFFGKKKEKEPDERALAVAYREWQNHLEKQVSIATSSSDGYKLLQVRNLVGLFTCLFVKQKVEARIANVQATSVKTGLKGRYGNKGGIVIRLTFDDTSMCFVNCHLAAGQKHVVARNNDVFSILDQAGLPAASEGQTKNNVFVCGGDGSMVLDHEICVLNGDLNYRINGARSQVIQSIKEGRLDVLLESDQLLVELKKNATHRLRSFTEGPIRFNPTYKYDPGTDNYDSSEKMRVPAWCDRIYYRGLGCSDIEAHAYQAHVCRVSDHRPVSTLLSMQVRMPLGKLSVKA